MGWGKQLQSGQLCTASSGVTRRRSLGCSPLHLPLWPWLALESGTSGKACELEARQACCLASYRGVRLCHGLYRLGQRVGEGGRAHAPCNRQPRAMGWALLPSGHGHGMLVDRGGGRAMRASVTIAGRLGVRCCFVALRQSRPHSFPSPRRRSAVSRTTSLRSRWPRTHSAGFL